MGKKVPRITKSSQRLLTGTVPESPAPDQGVTGDILHGRTRPKLTDFAQLRPYLLEIAQDAIEDTKKMQETTRTVEVEKESSRIYHFDRLITRQVDVGKFVAGLCPMGFYPATDPIVTIEADHAKILREYATISSIKSISRKGSPPKKVSPRFFSLPEMDRSR